MAIEKTVYLTQLYDLYQKLLTEKQRDMLSYYYEADYSLAEIADIYHISRQGVYDNIRRGEEALRSYEKALQLKEKYDQRLEKMKELEPFITDPQAKFFFDDLMKIL